MNDMLAICLELAAAKAKQLADELRAGTAKDVGERIVAIRGAVNQAEALRAKGWMVGGSQG